MHKIDNESSSNQQPITQIDRKDSNVSSYSKMMVSKAILIKLLC